MSTVANMMVKVGANTASYQTGLKKATSMTKNFAKGLATVGVGVAAGITVPLAIASGKAVQMGADAEEMLNKYNVVFDGMTDRVDQWATDYAKSVGRSSYDTKEYLSNLADLQIGLGMTQDEAFDLSKNIVTLGTDLASFNNLSDDTAIEALSKAMLGEAESAKQLGLLLNVDRVKAFAEAQGMVYDELSDATKAQLVYELAVTQSTNAIGDAERSSGSFTNQVKALKATISDTWSTVGMKLIPVATDLVTLINNKITPNLDDWIDKGFELYDSVKAYVEPKLKSFIEFIQTYFPVAKTVASTVFSKIQEYASNAAEFYQTTLLPRFKQLGDWWKENGPTVTEMAGDVFGGIQTVAEDVWKYFDETLLPIFGDVVSSVVDNWPEIKKTAKNVYEEVSNAIEPVVDLLGGEDGLIQRILDVNTTADSTLPKIKNSFVENLGIVGDIVSGIVEAIAAIDNLLLSLDAKLPDALKTGGLAGIFDLSEGFQAITGVDISNPLVGGVSGLAEVDSTGLTMEQILSVVEAERANPTDSTTTQGLGIINVNINGNINSEREGRAQAQKVVDALKQRNIMVK